MAKSKQRKLQPGHGQNIQPGGDQQADAPLRAGADLSLTLPSVDLGPAHAWDEFWFQASSPRRLVPIRLIISGLSALWLITVLNDSSHWYGAHGWNAAELSRRLSVATEGVWPARFRLSPLWMTSSAMVIQAWAWLGVLLCGLAALGIGGRVVRLALFLNVLWLAQRLTWSTEAFEPYVIALLGYLLIGPSHPWRPFQRHNLTDATGEPTWMATFALRLIQVHTYILLCFTLASMLSAETWWRGEGIWFLAATGHSNLLKPEWLIDQVLVVNLLSHGIVISCLLAVSLYWAGKLQHVGQACAMITALAIAILGDQLLYGVLLGACCLLVPRTSQPDA